MKITRIAIYKTELPYVGGTYVWGAGNAISVAKDTSGGEPNSPGLGVTPDFQALGEPVAEYTL